MTTFDSYLIQPIIRTDVTTHDHIWKSSSPPTIEESQEKCGQRPFSPPLKHITIESTQALLENFDPLDILDSASELSERSASSTDTMIMMTTEEERNNNERIKSSILDYELKKALSESSAQYKLGDKNVVQKRSVPNNYVSCQRLLDNAKQFRETQQLFSDEGYGTDSRSNTTASIPSPLSSSLSSLNTVEGTLSVGQSYTTNMQRGPIQKAPQIHSAGRSGHKSPGVVVKRRDTQTEAVENNTNLEDRLRALTTIEEEESGVFSGDRGPDKSSFGRMFNSERSCLASGHRELMTAGSPRERHRGNNPADSLSISGVSGCFRAVPVSVTANGPSSVTSGVMGDGTGNKRNGRGGDELSSARGGGGDNPSTSPQLNGDGWRDYTRYFEKDCGIPLHNIDPAGRGKFSTFNGDDVPDMDINQQIASGSPAHPKRVEFRFDPRGEMMVTERTPLYDTPKSDQVDFAEPRVHFQGDDQRGTQGRLSSGSRQPHVLSSMPDLRAQDPAWVPGSPSMTSSRYRSSHGSRLPYHLQQQQTSIDQFYFQQQQQQQQEEQQQQRQQPHHELQQSQMTQSHHQSVLSSTPAPNLHQYLQHMSQSSYLPEDTAGLSQSHPEVVLRRSRLTASATTLSARPERFSWQPGMSRDSEHQQLLEYEKLHSMGAERSSLDLGNIPQLQRQIRANSEMCLQASKRHMFASSADIYKLFQGQKKPLVSPTSQGSGFNSESRGQAYRHSFHAMPASMWPNLQSPMTAQSNQRPNPNSRPKLKLNLPSSLSPTTVSPGPVRGDHSITIPPEAWTTVPTSAQPKTNESDRPLFQRQSSGYSSENELQQIESNAKAAKGKRASLKSEHQFTVDTNFDFIPLNRSIDHDSNLENDGGLDGNEDTEPVYMNQPMLTRARTFDALNERPGSERYTHIANFNNGSSILASSSSSTYTQEEPLESHQGQHWPRQYPSRSIHNQARNDMYLQKITQSQVINLNSKPVTITSHVPAEPFSSYENNAFGKLRDRKDHRFGDSQNIRQRPDQQFGNSQQPIIPNDFQFANPQELKDPKDNLFIKPDDHPSSAPSQQGPRRRTSSSSSVPMSPVEIAQMLDVPFATNIISDESGDRLSTLV